MPAVKKSAAECIADLQRAARAVVGMWETKQYRTGDLPGWDEAGRRLREVAFTTYEPTRPPQRSARSVESVERISVTQVKLTRGEGTEADPVRVVFQYWTEAGEILAEYDPKVDDSLGRWP